MMNIELCVSESVCHIKGVYELRLSLNFIHPSSDHDHHHPPSFLEASTKQHRLIKANKRQEIAVEPPSKRQRQATKLRKIWRKKNCETEEWNESSSARESCATARDKTKREREIYKTLAYSRWHFYLHSIIMVCIHPYCSCERWLIRYVT